MPPLNIRRPLSLLTAFMLALTFAAVSRAELPDQFNLAPQNAEVVVLIKNIKSLSDSVNALADACNLPMRRGTLLESFHRDSGIEKGMNDEGAALITFTDLKTAMDNNDEPNPLFLVPVSDYDAFLSNFSVTDTGGVTSFKHQGKTLYSQSIPGYAVVSEVEKQIADYKPGNAAAAMAAQIGTLGDAYAQSSDVLVYVDVKTLAPSLDKKIQETIDEIKAEFDHPGAPASPMGDPKMIFDLYARAIRAGINSTDGLLLGVDVEEDGVMISKALKIKPDSIMAQLIPGSDKGVAGLLARLPRQPYIAAFAMNAKAVDLHMLMQKFVDAVPEDADNPTIEMYRQSLPMIDQVRNASFALYTPDNAAVATGSFIKAAYIYDVEDADAYIKMYRDNLTKMNGMTYDLGEGAPDANGNPTQMQMTVTTSFTENAMELDGVKVSSYEMLFNLPPEMMQQMGPMAMFVSAFTQYRGLVAAKDNRVMVTTSTDAVLAQQILDTMTKAGGLGAGDTIAQATQRLNVGTPYACSYLSADGVAATANVFMAMFGMPAVEIPQNLEPITTGFGGEGDGLGGQLFVPSKTVRFIVDTIQSLEQGPQGQNGQRNRGQGQDGPPPAPF